MTSSETISHNSHDHHEELYDKTVFGFWVYLLTDFILFAVLFAVYLVLRNNTFGGPPARELFDLSHNLVQTLILLVSTTIIGFAGACAHRKYRGSTIILFFIAFVLGIAFMCMELGEFNRLIQSGNSWQRSAFLSGYFTLIATHGLHMILALLWVIVLIIPVCIQGITPVSLLRLTCLRMFWQFLNVVWVFIFTIVYLLE